MRRLILYFILILFGFYASAEADLGKADFQHPPKVKKYIYDYAKILSGFEETVNGYLENIEKNYKIEAVIVTIPSLEGDLILNRAVEILNNWQIGKNTGGRGILLLMSSNEKEVKLEVSYELEDVFTDAFCHYIEELQLKNYFLNNQIGIGLIAVMEEIDNRAAIKYRGDYSRQTIRDLDSKPISGGAGARRELTKFEKEKGKSIDYEKYKAKDSPDASWKTLIQVWKDKIREPNLDIYTECTKLIERDYTNLSDSHYEENVRNYADRPFTVRPQPPVDNYAVIFFSAKEGWENPPFLFAKIGDKWKWDGVSMRKSVRYGNAPFWGIEFTDYNPYEQYLYDCPLWIGQDMPLEEEDIYRIEKDAWLASEILRLEEKLNKEPDNYETLIELGHLYTVCSMGPTRPLQILNKAKEISERDGLRDSRPYKYLAIAHVDLFYQYKQAMEYLKEFLELCPKSVFGHNFMGYLYYNTEQYEKTIDEFKKSIELCPQNNCYACNYLARCYGKLGGPVNLILANKWFEEAKKQEDCHPYRLYWLEYNLKNKKN